MKNKKIVLVVLPILLLGGCFKVDEDAFVPTSISHTIVPFEFPSGTFISSDASESNTFYSFDNETTKISIKYFDTLNEYVKDIPNSNKSVITTPIYEYMVRCGDYPVYDNTVATITKNNIKYCFFYFKNDDGTRGDFYEAIGNEIEQADQEAEKKYSYSILSLEKLENCELNKARDVSNQTYQSLVPVKITTLGPNHIKQTELVYIKATFNEKCELTISTAKVKSITNWVDLVQDSPLDFLSKNSIANKTDRIKVLFKDATHITLSFSTLFEATLLLVS